MALQNRRDHGDSYHTRYLPSNFEAQQPASLVDITPETRRGYSLLRWPANSRFVPGLGGAVSEIRIRSVADHHGVHPASIRFAHFYTAGITPLRSRYPCCTIELCTTIMYGGSRPTCTKHCGDCSFQLGCVDQNLDVVALADTYYYPNIY